MLLTLHGQLQVKSQKENAEHFSDFPNNCPFPPALARNFFWPTHNIKLNKS